MSDYVWPEFTEKKRKDYAPTANNNSEGYTMPEFLSAESSKKFKKIKAESVAHQERLAKETQADTTLPYQHQPYQYQPPQKMVSNKATTLPYQHQPYQYQPPQKMVSNKATTSTAETYTDKITLDKYLEAVGQNKNNTTIDPMEFDKLTELEKQKAISQHKKQEQGYAERKAEYEGMTPLQAFGYSSENIAASLLKIPEGISDFVGTTASYLTKEGLKFGSELLGGQRNAVGKAVNNASNAVKEFGEGYLKNDLVGEYEKNIKERYKPSPLQEKINNVGKTVTEILPSVAIAIASSGTSLIPQISNGLLAMGVSSAGNSASEAFKKTGDLESSLTYGALSGATETAIEKAFGGIPELGGGALDNIVGKLLKNEKVRTVVNTTVDRLGEGAEEALSTIVDPFLKRATYDPNASSAKKEEVIGSALLGALTSTVLGGAFKLGDKLIGKADPIKQLDPITQKMLNGEIGKPPVLQSTAQGESNIQSNTVKVDTSKIDFSVLNNFNEARKSFIQYAKENFPSTVVNKNTGMNIGISRNGLDKVLSGNITNEKYASAFNIPALIENSAKVSEADYDKTYGKQVENIKKYHYFDSDISIDNTQYKAHIRVRETDSGDKYYGHTLSGNVEKIEIEPATRADTQSMSWPVKEATGSIYNNSILSNSQKSNTSDENISNGTLIRGATTKSEKYQSASEKFFTDDISKIFGVSKTESRNALSPIVSEMSEAVKTGQNNPAKMDELFNKAYEAVRDVERTGINSNNHYSEDSEQLKELTRYEFDKKFDDYAEKMKYVARYENDQKTIAKKLEGKNATIAELKEAHKNLKGAQRESDKITAKYLLTTEETKLVDSMLKGGVSPNDLPNIKDINVANVKALYEAKNRVAEVKNSLDQYNVYRKRQLAQKAEELIANSDNWKDKKTGIKYSRETMERNIEDVVKDKAEAKAINDYYFKPVHNNEASSNRFKNTYRDKIRTLGLNKYESVYTQLYGEWKYHKGETNSKKSAKLAEDLEYKLSKFVEKNAKKIDKTKAEKASGVFSKIYDELFERVNDTLVVNGYPSVAYRKGYFPHFEDERSKSKGISDIAVKEKNLLEKAAKSIGFDISAKELPTDIAGLTHTFKPGKRWVGSFKERTGETTDYDAILGFDRYIEGVSDVIHHTEDIQKLRQLENSLKLKYSDTGKQEEYQKIWAKDITENERNAKLDELFGRDITDMGKLAQEVRTYTDNLAGKKSLHDRTIESDINRAIYQTVVNLENRTAGNMVAINPGSWLTNFIPLTQGGAQLSKKSMVKAARDTIKAYKDDDGFVDESTFLTNRKGSNALYETTLSKMQDKLSSPMYHIDMFTSNVLTRARVYDNMGKRKMTEADAMADASDWTGRLMADRSKGALPTVFTRKNPITKVFTMFQVEVNNQLSHLFKDIPRQYKEEGIAKFAGVLTQYVIGAYLYNELYEMVIGRRPALDPIGMIKESFEAGANGGIGDGIKSAGLSAFENMPFVGGLLGGGRVPISSAMLDFKKLSELFNDDMDGKKKAEIAGKELLKPVYYLGMPFGGGQVKKIAESTDSMLKGGSYTYNKEGEKQLQFPVDNTAENWVKGLLFGKYSQDGASGYVDKSFKPYSVNHTKAIDALKIDDKKPSEATRLIDQLKIIKGDGAAEKKRDLLLRLEGIKPATKSLLDDLVIGELKNKIDYSSPTAFKLSQMEDSQVAKFEAVKTSLSMDVDRFTECYDAIKNIEGNKNNKGNTIPGSAKDNKIAQLVSMGLTKSDAETFYKNTKSK